MTSVFDLAFAFTNSQEWSPGDEFSDDPGDPGGATFKGVTLGVFRTWSDNPEATVAQLKQLTDADREAIYAVGYWNPCRCDVLPPAIAFSVVDEAFNAGPSRSIRLLQACLGLAQDGNCGPDTQGAVARRSPRDLLGALSARQEAFYRSLPTFARFGADWTRRLQAREAGAMRLLPGAADPGPVPLAPVKPIAAPARAAPGGASDTAETLMAAELARLNQGA